jgi:hypothetical protein
MDWMSAGVHRQKLEEWGLDGNPEQRMNPFLAHHAPGTVSTEALAQEPDPMDRVQAAALEAMSRPDGQFSPGAGLSPKYLQQLRSRQAAMGKAQEEMQCEGALPVSKEVCLQGTSKRARAELPGDKTQAIVGEGWRQLGMEGVQTEVGCEGPQANVNKVAGSDGGFEQFFTMPFGMVPGMSVRDWGPTFSGGNNLPYDDPASPTLRM